MNDTLKVAGRIGAELGAAKAENERLREALQAMLEECDPMRLNCGEPWCRARDALLPKSEPCGGCGNSDESKRCIGCAHPFTPVPTDTFTAVDMATATAAAQGFRDGQAAVEQAAAQDEREAPEVVGWRSRWIDPPQDNPSWQLASQPEQKPWIEEEPLMTVAQHERIVAALARPAQTEQQPIRMPSNELEAVLEDVRGVRDLSDVAHGWYEATECVARLNAALIAQTAPDADMRDNYLDLLQEVLDAKEVMRAAGIEQGSFGAMFKQLAKQTAPQPEQSGLADRLNSVIAELKAGFVVCRQCGDQEDTATLDCVPELEAIAAALSTQGASK